MLYSCWHGILADVVYWLLWCILASVAWSPVWSGNDCDELAGLSTCWCGLLSCMVYFLERFIDSYVILAGLVF